ncbi:MAG TPA: penicillin-binding transpeptidase domain-containing protein [Chitinophagaceae bacterium]|nr:penicillin-binding transpeptidase domain-containing protein [Chitinophagaceae bacterium]
MRRLALLLLPLTLLFAACQSNNVTEDKSLKRFFDSAGVTGSFGLFDNAQGQFTIYNLPAFKDSAYLPASTFKIVNSLIGLQTGRISSTTMVIPWDGITRFYPLGDTAVGWNKDLSMKEAFQASAVPYYQAVARRIGKDTMQFWLDTLGYGQRYGKFKIGANLDTFWLDNSVKVTGDEQLGLVKKLYFDQLPFFKSTQQAVRNVMLQEENANYRLSYKTGWGFQPNGQPVGWIIGWIEENKHPYFFSLEVNGPNRSFDMRPVRIGILKGILQEMGFFKGKR